MAPRDEVNPVWNLFDAATKGHAIRFDCPACRHVGIFHPAALWLMFNNKGWDDDLRHIKGHFYCGLCHKRRAKRVRPNLVLSPDKPDQHLPLPSDSDWKRAISRRR